MPRWPENHVNKRTCPSCGGKKDFYAAMCRKCAEPNRPQLGRKGADHPKWRGGRVIDKDGYVRVYVPDYERRRSSPYMLEHVLVTEQFLGRRLTPTETVHHKDHDRQNNDLANLEVLERGAHSRHHRSQDVSGRKRDRGKFA